MYQGTFYYPGITGVLSASVTFSLGINPSVTQLTIPPTPGLQKRGTAVWSYNGVVRVLPNSMLGPVQVTRRGGAVVWSVSILDRRWAWTTGQISGEYNVQSGTSVIESTAKNPRELATLCLEAMGEVGYDVSVIPVNDQPYVNWQVEVPAKALANLCEQYGCAVCLGIDNRVRIVRMGIGADLPLGYLSNDDSVDPGDIPKALACVTAPTQWQVDLELEAVGAEYDKDAPDNIGEIKPIDDLSYAPEGGWGQQADYQDFSKISDEDIRNFATRCVWKWYRVKIKPAVDANPDEEVAAEDSDPKLPAALVKLKDIQQILPLLDVQVMTEGTGQYRKPKPAVVWGRFYDGNELLANNTNAEPTAFRESLVTKQSFSIDAALGIVKFSEAMIRKGDTSINERTVERPNIKLRCAINLRDEETRAPQRQFKQIALDPTAPTQAKYTVRDDIIPKFYQRPNSSEWINNAAEVEQQANFYLQQEMANFQVQPGSTADYAGFIPIDNDGAILQITYSIDNDGRATTKISRNIEQFNQGLTYKEARQRQKLWEAVERDQRQRKKRLDPDKEAS